MKSLVEAKRSYSKYTLHYKISSTSKRKISVIQSDLLGNEKINPDKSVVGLHASTSQDAASSGEDNSNKKRKRTDDNDDDTNPAEEEEEPANDAFKDDLYIFREGSIPPYRQMFYQVTKQSLSKLANFTFLQISHFQDT